MKMKVNDVELYYEVHGEGEPIIFLHGWMDDHTVWNSQVDHFSKRYKVITYDHRGHGKSDKPPKGNYSMKTLAKDCYSLMQKLDIEKTILVGHSMGSFTSLTFTIDHPAKVSKLVLVGTSAYMPGYFRTMPLMGYFIPYELLMMMVNITFKYYKPSREIFEGSMERCRNTPKHVSYDCLNEWTLNYDLRDHLHEIKIPTLIVTGKHDLGTPVRGNRYVSEKIKDSRLRLIPNAGHMSHIKAPEELNKIIEEFVGR